MMQVDGPAEVAVRTPARPAMPGMGRAVSD